MVHYHPYTSRSLSLLRTIWIQFAQPFSTPLCGVLISSHLLPRTSKWSAWLRFPYQTPLWIYLVTQVCHIITPVPLHTHSPNPLCITLTSCEAVYTSWSSALWSFIHSSINSCFSVTNIFLRIRCHSTDYVHVNGHDRTILVILAKYCT